MCIKVYSKSTPTWVCLIWPAFCINFESSTSILNCCNSKLIKSRFNFKNGHYLSFQLSSFALMFNYSQSALSSGSFVGWPSSVINCWREPINKAYLTTQLLFWYINLFNFEKLQYLKGSLHTGQLFLFIYFSFSYTRQDSIKFWLCNTPLWSNYTWFNWMHWTEYFKITLGSKSLFSLLPVL